MTSEAQLKKFIRTIPNFPKPGINFRDITPLLSNPEVFGFVIDKMAEHCKEWNVTSVVSAEARGFIFAAPLAIKLNASFVPIRKPGKLPFDTHSFHYELEYGKDSLEMHTDAVQKKDRVLLVDDLLATGGTVDACLQMVEKEGAEIAGCVFLIELDDLNGREKLVSHNIFSLMHYREDEV